MDEMVAEEEDSSEPGILQIRGYVNKKEKKV